MRWNASCSASVATARRMTRSPSRLPRPTELSIEEVTTMAHKRTGLGSTMERLSHLVTQWTGSSWAFAIAVAIILVWLVTGPLFGFSDTWQLVVNTGTTIITFLMVFLIQRSQNKDSQAVHLKLNEIVAAIEG